MADNSTHAGAGDSAQSPTVSSALGLAPSWLTWNERPSDTLEARVVQAHAVATLLAHNRRGGGSIVDGIADELADNALWAIVTLLEQAQRAMLGEVRS